MDSLVQKTASRDLRLPSYHARARRRRAPARRRAERALRVRTRIKGYLFENRYRFLIPELGVYTSPDPMHKLAIDGGVGPASYVYAEQRPNLNLDPDGRLAISFDFDLTNPWTAVPKYRRALERSFRDVKRDKVCNCVFKYYFGRKPWQDPGLIEMGGWASWQGVHGVAIGGPGWKAVPGVVNSFPDGLPRIYIGKIAFEQGPGVLRETIAHETSHSFSERRVRWTRPDLNPDRMRITLATHAEALLLSCSRRHQKESNRV